MADAGVPDAELTKAGAMAKLYCADTAMWVTTEAVQFLGGYGYIRVPGRAHDARREDHADLRGLNEIQRLVIAREMVKEQRAFLLAGVG